MEFSSINPPGFAPPSLCQNHHLSCGACCGLFNLNLDRQGLEEVLQKRTREVLDLTQGFSYFPRQQALRWQENRVAREQDLGRFSDKIYICPFLGYLDAFASGKGQRLGCLLHPSHWLAQGFELPLGADFRDISFYGQSICETYDCSAKDNLSEIDMELLDIVCRDALSYSAVVADYRGLFFLLRLASELAPEDRDSEPLAPFVQQAKESPKARDAWRNWLALVYEWPYRKPHRGYIQCSFDKNWSDFGLQRHLAESAVMETKDLREVILVHFSSWEGRVDDKLVWQLLDALHSRFDSFDEMQEGVALLAQRFADLVQGLYP